VGNFYRISFYSQAAAKLHRRMHWRILYVQLLADKVVVNDIIIQIGLTWGCCWDWCI